MLKRTPRSGYQFLGAGRESVAEHSFMITFIAYVMARMRPEADAARLAAMCLVHDLPEARTGDMNYVQKRYVAKDEEKAIDHMTEALPLDLPIRELVAEFNRGETLEARLARDADQLSLVLDLKSLQDIGYRPPEKWLAVVPGRLKTRTGKALCEAILSRGWDDWWLKNYVDN